MAHFDIIKADGSVLQKSFKPNRLTFQSRDARKTVAHLLLKAVARELSNNRSPDNQNRLDAPSHNVEHNTAHEISRQGSLTNDLLAYRGAARRRTKTPDDPGYDPSIAPMKVPTGSGIAPYKPSLVSGQNRRAQVNANVALASGSKATLPYLAVPGIVVQAERHPLTPPVSAGVASGRTSTYPKRISPNVRYAGVRQVVLRRTNMRIALHKIYKGLQAANVSHEQFSGGMHLLDSVLAEGHKDVASKAAGNHAILGHLGAVAKAHALHKEAVRLCKSTHEQLQRTSANALDAISSAVGVGYRSSNPNCDIANPPSQDESFSSPGEVEELQNRLATASAHTDMSGKMTDSAMRKALTILGTRVPQADRPRRVFKNANGGPHFAGSNWQSDPMQK